MSARRDAAAGARLLARRIAGGVMLFLAFFLAWVTHGFHAENDLSKYPQVQLTYTNCLYERIAHSKGATTRQIVFLTVNGRFVMEDGVWHHHFQGPNLATQLAGGGTVRAWLHPQYHRALRGIIGGAVDIPPAWGLEYDQRNMRAGMWVYCLLAVVGSLLIFWRARASLKP